MKKPYAPPKRAAPAAPATPKKSDTTGANKAISPDRSGNLGKYLHRKKK